MRVWLRMLAAVLVVGSVGSPARAGDFSFSTGDPDGLMAMASRPAGAGGEEIETGDDFILDQATRLTSLSFTGLLTGGATTADVSQVVVEIYRVFPLDSTDPPSGNVPTRVNSPSDVAFTSRDSTSGGLTFGSTVLASSFTAGNSVLNGIHPLPGVTTGGDGAVTGAETLFDVALTVPITLDAGHYFLVTQVLMSGADQQFYWLSAPRPIVAPGTPFAPDLQTWIRNEALAPDWLRVGTDIEGQGRTFNAAFSLTGTIVPEPSSLALAAIAAAAVGGGLMKPRRPLA
ncbi:PEP-CTERM sorting domain-containing protein [Planctomyces sp. SH-PL62]|uniref:PEP-CTERM sorting domain-containing protein n=1 Tax=Planctomyces sp. SH-PL62 TaxID=1636152 RepID=UPI00078B4A97|nr:PEP-CTERM sorting domain-containing protein [Planctomyces sp. SH-PL62]AMV40659.1 hypothetical protein VT85_24725 [Planctomyces sp. SH-PL62]